MAGTAERSPASARLIEGTARFVDGKTVAVTTAEGEGHTITAEAVVIATGSVPVELPFLPFGGDVISSTEALSLSDIPQTLAVVGGGYIGLELGTAFAKLGSKVTVVEMADRILAAGYRRIGFVGTHMPEDHRARKRLLGFEEGLAAAGVQLEAREYYQGGSSLLKGRELTERILAERPQETAPDEPEPVPGHLDPLLVALSGLAAGLVAISAILYGLF